MVLLYGLPEAWLVFHGTGFTQTKLVPLLKAIPFMILLLKRMVQTRGA